MPIDPFTIAAIGSAASGAAQGLGQALAPAPAYSAAQADSFQGGVNFTPSVVWGSDFNVVGGGARGGSLGNSEGGGLSLAGNSGLAAPTGAIGGTIQQFLPLILIGGLAWFLLRKK